jgi:hypothetical protein
MECNLDVDFSASLTKRCKDWAPWFFDGAGVGTQGLTLARELKLLPSFYNILISIAFSPFPPMEKQLLIPQYSPKINSFWQAAILNSHQYFSQQQSNFKVQCTSPLENQSRNDPSSLSLPTTGVGGLPEHRSQNSWKPRVSYWPLYFPL